MNKQEKKRFLAGLVCGEGCFSYYMSKRTNSKGVEYSYPEWRFIIDMHKRDLILLYMIRDEIGVGKVRVDINKGNKARSGHMCRYEICSRQLNVDFVIPYFEGILYGYKLAQFEMWKESLVRYREGTKERKRLGGLKAWKTRQESK